MADDAGPFQKADDLSDLVLLVDGGELYVHKLMLMLHSPVFKRMLSSDFAEKDAKQRTLPGKKRKDLVEFLKQIYAMYSCNAINDDNVMGVLSLADEYQVDQVTTKCRNFIQQQTSKLESLKVDQVLLYLGLCGRYRFDNVKGRLVQHVQNVVSAKDAAKSPFYNMVDVTLMRDIMQSKVVAGLQERANNYVDKTSHEKLRQDNLQLTKKIGELQSTISSLERRRVLPKHDRPTSFLQKNFQIDWIVMLLVIIIWASVLLNLIHHFVYHLLFGAQVEGDGDSGNSAAKALNEL